MMPRPAFLLAALLSALPPASAQTPLAPTPVTGEARMVTFDYDDDRIYKVLVRPRHTTQLKLADDERVTYVSAGDTSSFIVTVPSSKAFVEVKPKWDNVSTNLLVVTTRRSYHVELQSTSEGRKWYTRVAWSHGAAAVLDQTTLADTAVPPQALGAVPPASAVASGVSLDKLSFKYDITGDAPFRPVQVFDDGTHTYVRLPDTLQELPALFFVTPDEGDIALVNYSVSAPYLVVPRTMDRFMLKLGKAQVDVARQAARTGWWSRLRWGGGGD